MNLRWSLDDLYEGFESEKFKSDFESAKDYVERFKKWDAEPGGKSDTQNLIEEYLNMMKEYGRLNLLMSYSSLTQSVEAENENALKYIDRLRELYTELSTPQVRFMRFVAGLGDTDLDTVIRKSALIKEHEFYIREIKSKSKYMLSEAEELVIAKMKTTGSGAWSQMVAQLTSTLQVDMPGEQKKLPLPAVRNMAHDKSREVRKKAYEAELNAYTLIEKPVAAALNGIKGEVIGLCKLRGYDSPLDMTLSDARMDRETLDALLSAMRDSLPLFRKYFRKKAELLGYKSGLPFYDLVAPFGEADMRFTYEEAADYVVENFNAFSPDLGKFARYAFDNRWLDVEPRDGKRGGAFCSGIQSIKQCRILSNFSGSLNDVFTLAHELGHGFHGYCLRGESLLNTGYTMPIAETASNFCEELVSGAALKTASPSEAITILEQKIADAAQVIVDIYSRFLFEDEVFKRRADGSLTVNELKEIMINAQKASYGDGLDENFLHPYMWVNKTHYYFPSRNYYNFPYAYGMLFTKGLYSLYLKEGESFVKRYELLLAETGKNSLADIAEKAGIDVRDKDFWMGSIKLIGDDIERFISF